MRKNTGAKTFLLAILVGVGTLPASGDVSLFEPARLRAVQEIAAEVTIYRDHYGVPHVFGPTDASAVFGAAYARAEDKLLEDEISILYVLGRSAELDGEEGLAADVWTRAVGVGTLEALAPHVGAGKRVQGPGMGMVGAISRTRFIPRDGERDLEIAPTTGGVSRV